MVELPETFEMLDSFVSFLWRRLAALIGALNWELNEYVDGEGEINPLFKETSSVTLLFSFIGELTLRELLFGESDDSNLLQTVVSFSFSFSFGKRLTSDFLLWRLGSIEEAGSLKDNAEFVGFTQLYVYYYYVVKSLKE